MGQINIYNSKVFDYRKNMNSFVAKYVKSNTNILDVGCSTGVLGKYLKKSKKATVSGVDVANTAIIQAKKVLDEAFCVDIERENSLAFKEKSFDIIICADILEHLLDPLSILKKLKKYLKDDGYFILSIPNIANLKIRSNLLFGKFEYTKIGILDNTHIRFFTRNTAIKLMQNANLIIKKIDYIPCFSFLLLKDRYIKKYRPLQKIKYFLTRLRPTLFCSQFIIIARKNDLP